MYRDLQKGARVEADHILGDLLTRGRNHGVEAPLVQAAFAQLSVYSASLKA
jgi:2-dehydropantoate 2-reductase